MRITAWTAYIFPANFCQPWPNRREVKSAYPTPRTHLKHETPSCPPRDVHWCDLHLRCDLHLHIPIQPIHILYVQGGKKILNNYNDWHPFDWTWSDNFLKPASYQSSQCNGTMFDLHSTKSCQDCWQQQQQQQQQQQPQPAPYDNEESIVDCEMCQSDWKPRLWNAEVNDPTWHPNVSWNVWKMDNKNLKFDNQHIQNPCWAIYLQVLLHVSTIHSTKDDQKTTHRKVFAQAIFARD